MESAIAGIEQSVRRLEARWAETAATWRDVGATKFEGDYVQPLEREGEVARRLLTSLAAILEQARRTAP